MKCDVSQSSQLSSWAPRCKAAGIRVRSLAARYLSPPGSAHIIPSGLFRTSSVVICVLRAHIRNTEKCAGRLRPRLSGQGSRATRTGRSLHADIRDLMLIRPIRPALSWGTRCRIRYSGARNSTRSVFLVGNNNFREPNSCCRSSRQLRSRTPMLGWETLRRVLSVHKYTLYPTCS